MPPIPSRLPEEALSLLSAAERRYKHISEALIPELRRFIGPISLQQQLADGVREDTLALSRQIEALDIMVDDQQGEKNRKELREIVNDLQRKLESLRKDTRAALLASKRAIDANQKASREELLTFSAAALSAGKTSSEKTAEDALMKANSDVTDALRRTISLMQSELERSVLSTQLLDESTSTLRSTSLQHDTLSSVMSTSKQLVTALEKSDWLDRVLILSGFVFFILVVLFILKQRIVDRGMRIAFWWTRFIPSFGDDAELLRQAEKGMASVVGEVSGSVASAITSAVSMASSMIHVASFTSSAIPSISSTPISEPSASLNEQAPSSVLSSVISETSGPSASTSSIVVVESEAPTSVITQAAPSDIPVHVEL
ncbi:Sec20-domain-containing protein [Pholiota conissans]|uniref:Sec20-domain-containing protein n=1 Tax=Pholiota conissans TaxID=109636 RepID=A0A9P6CZ48_9AGAR|nr:Sec20-domain-containing protein [Pholiota conissans]